jgi:hypothetical protein
MASGESHRKKHKKGKRSPVSRRMRAGFYLNALLFVLLVIGLMYHAVNMIYSYGLPAVNWTDSLLLAGGHALLLTWHYRIVFLRVYRALDGLYTHFFVFAGVVGYMWHEFFMFPEIRGNTVQDRLIFMAVWSIVLVVHAYRVWTQQQQGTARHEQTSDNQQATQPDTSRLIDRTDTSSAVVQRVRSAGEKRSQQPG